MEQLTIPASILTSSAITENTAAITAVQESVKGPVRKQAWELVCSTTWKGRDRYPQPDRSASALPDIFGPDTDELTGPEPHADYADASDDSAQGGGDY